MQPPFSCTATTFSALEGSLAAPRLARYLGESSGDKHLGLRLYVWNGYLCEAFYLPAQTAEVCVRNAIHKVLQEKHGANWYQRGSFLCTLPDRLRRELDDVIRDERGTHGTGMTSDHIVSGLSFGFWVHLLTKPYEGVFWPTRFGLAFPHKPNEVGRMDLYTRLDRLRIFRNRIAHHKPIFDKGPKAEYLNMLDLISWVCPDTRWFIGQISRVDQTIGMKPRI